jgi:hypothetical protein
MNVACTQCGAPSLRGNRFCGRCGSPLPPSTGNLPTSTLGSPPQPAPARVRSGATSQASASPCWQCGGPVDLLHQVTCANCGARLVAGPPQSAAVPAYAAPDPGAPTPTATPATGALLTDVAPAVPKEPLLNGAALTLIVAILIVLALAIAGIVAGQAI